MCAFLQKVHKCSLLGQFRVPSNGVISSPFSSLTNFFSKKREGNPMFLIVLDLSKFGVWVLPNSFYDFADS
jgi:hypothetical protein